MSVPRHESPGQEKLSRSALERDTAVFSQTAGPAPRSICGAGRGALSPPTEPPRSVGLSHFTNSSPTSGSALRGKAAPRRAPPAKPLADASELTFSEMKALVSSEVNFSAPAALARVFEEVSRRCAALSDFDRRRQALGVALQVFEAFNTRRLNLRQRVRPPAYERFFRTVFAWDEPVFAFELACIDFEYSKRTDKNFAVLVRHLTSQLHRLDAHTYLRLFVRLTYFVNVRFRRLRKALGGAALKTPAGRKQALAQLEGLNEFRELIRLNKIELFRERRPHRMDEHVPALIHKALRLTGDFPYSDFEVVNRNLARVFFLHCRLGASLSPEKFWNCATFAVNMFPGVPLALCSPVLKSVIEQVSFLKALHSLLAPRRPAGGRGNMSLILQVFRFKPSAERPLRVGREVLSKIEKFSCYSEEAFEALLAEQRRRLEHYIDPSIYLFKKLMTVCLNGFYFLQMVILGNPAFEQLALLRSTEDIFRRFLRLGVALGIQLARHSKRISMSSREILRFIEGKVRASSMEKQKLMKTIIKIKRAYESVFTFMDARRKLYSFVRLSQRSADAGLFELMSLFVY